MLYELIYTSVANAEFGKSDLDEILGGACSANEARGITGILLHDGQGFIQLIEGERDSVEQVFEKIKADTRHTDVKVFHRGQISSRTFGEWSMAYQRVDPQTGIRALYDALTGGDPRSLPDLNGNFGMRMLRLLNDMGIR